MGETTIQAINRFLAAELGKSVPRPDVEKLETYRRNFLRRFGPESLEALSDEELLRRLPHNDSAERPMDYWLEFKNDEEFESAPFGSLGGGSATKFGAWLKRETGEWWGPGSAGGPRVQRIPDSEALRIVDGRRRELLAAVAAIEPFRSVRVEDVDPESFHRAVTEAAPTWGMSAWLHKYLHIWTPYLVTWDATLRHLQAALYRMGGRPDTKNRFALDVRALQLWASLPALESLPLGFRMRIAVGLEPRDHWVFTLGDGRPSADEMLDGEFLAVDPVEVGDLTEVLALTRVRELKRAVPAAFTEAGLEEDDPRGAELIDVARYLDEDDVVALVSGDGSTVAIGVVTGSYAYEPGARLPHRFPVRWWTRDRIHLPESSRRSGGLVRVPPEEPAVAEIESALLLAGGGHWPTLGAFLGKDPVEPRKGRRPDGDSVPLPGGVEGRILQLLERKGQVILYGPPGTGKTYHAENVALSLVARHDFERTREEVTDRLRREILGEDGEGGQIAMCTFHPEYSYEDFVEGYRPDGKAFRVRPGIFRRMVERALAAPDRLFVLIIDEINRGNLPKIFGELITLLEWPKRGKSRAILPFSEERFTVPRNLFVIGTMNTADRSILLLDTALRRRFGFVELMPDPQVLRDVTIGEIPLATWLRALNRRIVDQLGHDGRNLQVGHSYLMVAGKPISTLRRFGEVFRDEIWPLLQECCYEDPGRLAAVIGSGTGGLYDPERRDLRHDLFAPGREADLAQALGSIIALEDQEEAAETEGAEETDDTVEEEEAANGIEREDSGARTEPPER